MKKPKPESESPPKAGMYRRVFLRVFESKFRSGATQVEFTRSDIEKCAVDLGLDPKNFGDLVYSYRYRAKIPPEIGSKAPKDHVWIIRGVGDAKYRMLAVANDYALIKPREGKVVIDIPDATPGVITRYARNEEQALLAKVRYNRLVDIFLGITCYSLQSHLRTKIPAIGQVETDELYVGIDDDGQHYTIPVQAKGGSDGHSIVQIEQDYDLCTTVEPFKKTTCIPVAAQFLSNDEIALFSFAKGKDDSLRIRDEKHYRLVPEPSQERKKKGSVHRKPL